MWEIAPGGESADTSRAIRTDRYFGAITSTGVETTTSGCASSSFSGAWKCCAEFTLLAWQQGSGVFWDWLHFPRLQQSLVCASARRNVMQSPARSVNTLATSRAKMILPRPISTMYGLRSTLSTHALGGRLC